MDSRQIEERAAAWLAQRDSGNWTPAHERDLSQWLDEATVHTIAFIRLESVWSQALRIKALGAGVPPRVVPGPEQFQLSPFFDDNAQAGGPLVPSGTNTRPKVTTGKLALAASILLTVAAAFYFGSGYLRGEGYSTAVGVTTAVPLSDGSKVILNTNSSIRVAVDDRERRIELRQGEAFFEVISDSSRPFVVNAGDKRIVVLGTKFSVKRDGNEVRIVVTEGKVRLEDKAAAGGEVLLTAGSVAETDHGKFAVEHRPLPRAEELLSWRAGYLTFQDTSLAAAAAEFNRYNRQKIVIQDPGIAAMKMSGKFKPNEFDAFTRLLEDGYPIRAIQEDNRILLTTK